MAARRWIIGRGLLGRAIARSRDDVPFARSVPWGDPARAGAVLREGLQQFFQDTGPHEIYWSAGRGVTSSTEEELEIEVGVFRDFLNAVAAVAGPGRDVRFFLASSVGGAYAGAALPPFDESTLPHPQSAYGRAKLEMEMLLRSAAAEHGWRSFIARITNLYGPGQDLLKPQGLISVVIASYVTNKPVSLYVSLDTLRDYIYEDDCARVIEAAMRRLEAIEPGQSVLKIVGSMTAMSIGALLGETTRLRRRRSLIVLGQGNATGQASDLRVRSAVWTDLDALVRTTLPEGLDAVFRSQLAGHAQGHLNP